jgi:hypothetical protein
MRGGRSYAVAGNAAQPDTFYMGSVGGGVWKTEPGRYTVIFTVDGRVLRQPVTILPDPRKLANGADALRDDDDDE